MKFGYVDYGKKIIVPLDYNVAFPCSEGIMMVGIESNNKMVFGGLNKKGGVIIPFIYSDAGMFQNGLCAVKKDGKWGYVDRNNNIVIPFKFKSATSFVHSFAYVGIEEINKKERFFYIDKLGNEVFVTK